MAEGSEGLSLGEAIEQIKADLGLDDDLRGKAAVEAAQEDLGLEDGGGTLREEILRICSELGVETGWEDQASDAAASDAAGAGEPEPEAVVAAEPEVDTAGDADTEDLTDDEKLGKIFEKFDADGDSLLNKEEASAYSVAKEGEGLDDDTWAQICEVLEVDPAVGMALAEFQKMYELTAGEGNDVTVDYLKLCLGLDNKKSVAKLAEDAVLLVRITGTETTPDGKDIAYVIEVTEEEDDYPVSTMKYRYKDFQGLRKKLVGQFAEVKNLDFPTDKADRTAKLDAFLSKLMEHPDVRRTQEFCNFLGITVPEAVGDDAELAFEEVDADAGKMMATLDSIYEKVINGIPGQIPVKELAAEYKTKIKGTMRERVDGLIRFFNTQAGAQGFATSIGGAIVGAALLPANIAALLYIWIRMSATIAAMGGHDVTDEGVKSIVFLCMLGGEKPDDAGAMEAGKKLAQVVAKRVLIAFGRKQIGRMGAKVIPGVSGFIGGAYDLKITNNVGNVARDLFVPPDWIKQEQERTTHGINIFFPDAKSWLKEIKKRIENTSDEEPTTPLQQRKVYYDKKLLPNIITLPASAKVSTYIALSNETPWVLVRTTAELTSGTWVVEPPTDILPGEIEVPFAAEAKGMNASIEGEIQFVAETDAGPINIFLQFTNAGKGRWVDAEVKAPLRVESVATAEKNNKATFRILPGVGTFRRRGPKVVAAEITMEAVRNTAVDIPKEIKTRRSYMDLYIAPRLVSIIRDARRSSYVSIQNETEFQIYCTGFNTKTGNWVCEPPGEIFPNELNVLFGNASGKKPQGCEAEVNFVAVTEDGSIPILLRWCNPLMAGTRGKWWDAECAAPLRIEGLATQDENNKVTFRFMKGSGTQLKYTAGGETADSASRINAAMKMAEDWDYEKQTEEMARRRDTWNTQILPTLIQAQLKASRSSYVSINNHTSSLIFRSNMELQHGMWTVEPPSEIFPGETDVPFGVQSRGPMLPAEGSVEFVCETQDAGRATIMLKWSNAGRGRAWADAEAPFGFTVEMQAADADNNNVSFTIMRGEGTERKYGDGGPSDAQLKDMHSNSNVVLRQSVAVDVSYEGWMEKKGEGGRFKSAEFKRRWFKLHDGILEYFNEEGGKSKGEVDLRKCMNVRTSADDPLVLELVSRKADGAWRLFYFKCDDEDSVEQWTTFIKKALGA